VTQGDQRDPDVALRTRAELRALRRVLPKKETVERPESLLARVAGALLTAGFGLAAGFLRILPADVALELGATVGSVCSLVLRSRRKTARKNLELALPEKTDAERARILRRSFENVGRTFVEFLRFPAYSKADIAALVRIEGLEHFQRYRAANPTGGVLALSAHLGNFELISAVFNAIDVIPSSLIGRKIKPEAVDAFVCGLRMSQGVATIANKESVRDVMARVGRGEGIGVVLDQNMRRGHGVHVPFFGKPASTTLGLAVLARRTGAPVFPVFMERVGVLGRHRLAISPPLAWDDSARDKKAALVANTALYTKVIEDAVRRRPEEWFWFHRRWRTQPLPGDESLPEAPDVA
jgi:Kdo2-lipid IVA lauroyltransferase/acyltransferase